MDVAFYGWSRAWLDPGFRAWDITDSQEECYCPVEVVMIPGVGHSPQRERPEDTLEAVAGFANRILKLHHEADAEGEPVEMNKNAR